jgi:hypothetical protein
MLIQNSDKVSNLFNSGLAFVIVNHVKIEKYIAVPSVQLMFSFFLCLRYSQDLPGMPSFTQFLYVLK